MPIVSLADIAKHRKPVSEVLAGLQSDSTGTSVEAGKKLVQKAQDAGLNLRDYLTLAVDVRAGEGDDKGRYEGLNGYEAALAHLNLPFKNDLENGVVLQAAADSFGTYPGTRAMFPEVLDDMLRQTGRIESIENVASLVGNTRTINQTEMISTVLNDTADEDDTFTIAEFGKIPVPPWAPRRAPCVCSSTAPATSSPTSSTVGPAWTSSPRSRAVWPAVWRSPRSPRLPTS